MDRVLTMYMKWRKHACEIDGLEESVNSELERLLKKKKEENHQRVCAEQTPGIGYHRQKHYLRNTPKTEFTVHRYNIREIGHQVQ